MSNLRNDLAAHICRVDGDNELSPYHLAVAIVEFLSDRQLVTPIVAGQVEDFAEAQNRGVGYRHPKPMGAAALADAIVDRFKLEEETR